MEGLGLLHPLAGDSMPAQLTCPRDGSLLRSNAVGSAEVFVCDSCHGLWISGYDMASLMRSPYESWKLPWPEKAGGASTTVDNTVRCLCTSRSLMTTLSRKGVAVDVCPECRALWFDGGELEQVIRKRGSKSYGGNLEFEGSERAEVIGDGAFLGADLLLEILVHFFDPL